jgi:hypothetical protein
VKGVHFPLEILVCGDLLKPGLLGELEHPEGTVVGPMPEIGIQMPEKTPGIGLPSPPQVERYFTKGLKGFRKLRNNVEGMYRQHLCPFGYSWRPRENPVDATFRVQ